MPHPHSLVLRRRVHHISCQRDTGWGWGGSEPRRRASAGERAAGSAWPGRRGREHAEGGIQGDHHGGDGPSVAAEQLRSSRSAGRRAGRGAARPGSGRRRAPACRARRSGRRRRRAVPSPPAPHPPW
jgi:hypothetical protein